MNKEEQKALIKPGVELLLDPDLHVNLPDRGVQALALLDYPSGTPVNPAIIRGYIDQGLIEAEMVLCISLTSAGRLKVIESKGDAGK